MLALDYSYSKNFPVRKFEWYFRDRQWGNSTRW